MKKLLLTIALGAISINFFDAKEILSVNSVEDIEDITEVFTNEKKNKLFYCQEYNIETWCNPGKLYAGTVCYEPTNSADRERAFECMERNARLMNVFFCGRERSSDTNGLGY